MITRVRPHTYAKIAVRTKDDPFCIAEWPISYELWSGEEDHTEYVRSCRYDSHYSYRAGETTERFWSPARAVQAVDDAADAMGIVLSTAYVVGMPMKARGEIVMHGRELVDAWSDVRDLLGTYRKMPNER